MKELFFAAAMVVASFTSVCHADEQRCLPPKGGFAEGDSGALVPVSCTYKVEYRVENVRAVGDSCHYTCTRKAISAFNDKLACSYDNDKLSVPSGYWAPEPASPAVNCKLPKVREAKFDQEFVISNYAKCEAANIYKLHQCDFGGDQGTTLLKDSKGVPVGYSAGWLDDSGDSIKCCSRTRSRGDMPMAPEKKSGAGD